ncbi:response regulator transcription factor [Romboutsia sp.]|uniref:response regulator transcription factor n=1 Tax=Romboutsia sp. TaxID=1965302 RepID=UPI003F31AEDA
MNILIVSNSFIFREALCNVFSSKFKDYNLQSLESISKLTQIDLSQLDCIIADTNDKHVEKLLNLKTEHKHIKIIALDFTKNQEVFTKLIKAGIDGYILDMSDKDEFIYKVNMILKGKKYYDADILNNILNDNFKLDMKELTNRELEILEQVSEGLSNKEISKELYISEYTVKKHISSILSKLDFRSRKDIIIYAKDNNFNRDTYMMNVN